MTDAQVPEIRSDVPDGARVAPTSKIVYVDNDPLVLTHARALLVNTSPEGVTTYVEADHHDPDLIIAEAGEVLDLDQPVAVLVMGVFGYGPDPDEAGSIIARIRAAVPSGSYLAPWDGTDTSEAVRVAAQAQADRGSPYQLRSIEQMTRWFDGVELVEPGLVSVTHRRPDGPHDTEPIDAYCGVGRKP